MTIAARDDEATAIYAVETIAIGDTFAVPFKFLENDEYIRVLTRDNDGNEKELTLDSDYSVRLDDGTNNVFGYIEMLVEITNLDTICIYREVTISQETDFSAMTVFVDSVENSLDKLTVIAQDNNYIKRVIHAPIDDTLTDEALTLPAKEDRANGYAYFDENGDLKVGNIAEYFKSIRQPKNEEADETFEISAEDRQNKILAFDENAHVSFIKKYTAGSNIEISEDNVISSTNNYFVEGDNIHIEPKEDYLEISAIDTTYEEGENVHIDPDDNNRISAIDTKYTAGLNVVIDPNNNNRISTTGNTYTAGDNITISTASGTAGPAWTPITAPSNTSWDYMTYGDGVILGFSLVGHVNRSTDYGFTWERLDDLLFDPTSLAYGDGKFIVSLSGAAKLFNYSEDNGETWQEGTLHDTTVPGAIHKIAYGLINNTPTYVAVGYNRLFYSHNGIDWYKQNNAETNTTWNSVAYGVVDGLYGAFVAVGSRAEEYNIAYSSDGESWNYTTLQESESSTIPDLTSIVFCTHSYEFLAVGQTISGLSNNAGAEWRVYPGTGAYQSIAYGNGTTIRGGTNVLESSVSLINWDTPPGFVQEIEIWGNIVFCPDNNSFVICSTATGWIWSPYGLEYTISATDTTYKQGSNISIDATTTPHVYEISAPGYTGGANITISNYEISGTNTTYKQGENIKIQATAIEDVYEISAPGYKQGAHIQINPDTHEISADDTTYQEGLNIKIDPTSTADVYKISAINTVYTKGSNIDINPVTGSDNTYKIDAIDTVYTKGSNIDINPVTGFDNTYKIDAINTVYTKGSNIDNITQVSENTYKIDAIDTTYTKGSNIDITETATPNVYEISATDTTYTKGSNIDNITLVSENTYKIDAIDTTYTKGSNIDITATSTPNVYEISATNTVYTGGSNIDITATSTPNVYEISATNTVYTKGSNIDNITQVSENMYKIDAIDTTYTPGTNITIDTANNNRISATNTPYTAGDNITIDTTQNNKISADIYSAVYPDTSVFSGTLEQALAYIIGRLNA